jgi:hypothetical protein
MAYGEMLGFMGPRKIYFPNRGKIKYEGPEALHIFLHCHQAEEGALIPLEPYQLYDVWGPVTIAFPAKPGVYFARAFRLQLGVSAPYYGEYFFDGSELMKPHSRHPPEQPQSCPPRGSLGVASRRRTLSRRFESQRLPLVNSAGGVHWISGRPTIPPGRRRPARFASPLHGSGHSG